MSDLSPRLEDLESEGEGPALDRQFTTAVTTSPTTTSLPPVELEVRGSNGHAASRPLDSVRGNDDDTSRQSASKDGRTSYEIPQSDVLSLKCRNGARAPEKMRRGVATVHGNTAYFNSSSSREVYAYRITPQGDQWLQTPDYPNRFFSLAVVGGMVTGVGGMTVGLFSSNRTNTLLSLTGEGERKQWSEVFPPMPTPRAFTAAIATEYLLIVAGGGDKELKLDTVEVLEVNTQQWISATPLPQPLTSITGAIYGDQIFLGGFFQNHGTSFSYSFPPSQSLLSCPLSSLTSSPATQRRKLQPSESSGTGSWKTVCQLPVMCSTLVAFNDSLIAIGGELNDQYTTNVYRYGSQTNSWVVIGQMKNKRSMCLAAVLPDNQMVVVGGLKVDWFNGLTRIDSVEVLTPS